MRAGVYYTVGALPAKRLYVAQLRALYDEHGSDWNPASHLHRVLEAALAAAPVAERPAAPHHRGVPACPVFANKGYVRIAIYGAEVVAGTLKKAERAQYDAWLAQARQFNGRGTWTRKVLAEMARSVYVKLPATASRALEEARCAAALAYNSDKNGDGGDVSTREAMVDIVEYLGAQKLPIKPFLVGLDDVIVREDMQFVLDKAAGYEAKSDLDAVVWRAASDDKSTHWIGRLADGSYVLVYKARGRFQVIGGGREDVLASVPDEQMESALKAF